MKHEVAVRLAATAVEGVTVGQAETIIGSFLAELVRCPVCDGDGTITFGRDVLIELEGDRYEKPTFVRAGTTGSCPRCGSRETELAGRGDPDHVSWHCVAGASDDNCRSDQRRDDRRQEHERCGWRIVLPLPSATQ